MSTIPQARLATLARVPTREELTQQMQALLPGLTLYRGGDSWFSFQFAGKTLWIPPDMDGHPKVPHPNERDKKGRPVTYAANGEFQVRDQYGIYYDEKRRPAGRGPLVGQDSHSIVLFALEKFVDSGVVLLLGDADDDARRDISRKRVIESQLAWAKTEVDVRASFVANFRKQPQNQHRALPLPNRRQIHAQEIIDAKKMSGADEYKYICLCGMYATSDVSMYERHLKLNHPEEFEQWKNRQSGGTPKESPAKAG